VPPGNGEQVFAEVMLDFALEQHELVALMRSRIERHARKHQKIWQAHVRRDVPREAAQHGVVAEVVVEPPVEREIIRVVVDRSVPFS
jgi:hypothetical protein